MDGAPPPSLHPLETEIMEVLWDVEEASVREVLADLERRGRAQRAYTTVMTVCARLAAKGMLVRHRQGKADRYAASLSRDAYAELRAGGAVDALVAEAGEVALAHFARRLAALTPEQQQAVTRRARDLEGPTTPFV